RPALPPRKRAPLLRKLLAATRRNNPNTLPTSCPAVSGATRLRLRSCWHFHSYGFSCAVTDRNGVATPLLSLHFLLLFIPAIRFDQSLSKLPKRVRHRIGVFLLAGFKSINRTVRVVQVQPVGFTATTTTNHEHVRGIRRDQHSARCD